jgi:hypothetical protein
MRRRDEDAAAERVVGVERGQLVITLTSAIYFFGGFLDWLRR